MTNADDVVGGDVERLARLRDAYQRIRDELSKVIVGQHEVIDQLLIALFSRGHVILEGVPGLAKTLMISSLSRCLGLRFHRIQFTPDLMPSDITGTEVIQEDRATGERSFRFLAGPVFTHVLLADEINRTPPKTQAALLEAMQETQVSVGGVRHVIEPPFFVLATQNPIEQEGTYPLPEAQQDRFMFKVFVDYPGYDDEYAIAERTTVGPLPELAEVLRREEIIELQEIVRRIPVAPSVVHYALRLVRGTRPDEANSGTAAELVNRMVTFGAGPRAVQFLLVGGKARAAMHGRMHVATEDIRALARPVLRHRLVTNYAAEAEGYDPDRLVESLLAELERNAPDEDGHGAVAEVLGS
ncbi:MAG: MoxR family ATPase [Phycisphaerae bacterium]|nr:MoxR family ATPase [Phycisphaerae bacterium]